jgi:hypothetical protein
VKKILSGICFVFLLCCFAKAEPWDMWGLHHSTVIAANDINSVKVDTGVIYLDYYQVLSTGAYNSNIDIYDTNMSTTLATVSYTGFPTSTFYDRMPLDIALTSGCYIVNRGASGGAKVRIMYYLRFKK